MFEVDLYKQYSLKWWWRNRAKIDMSPSYQRKPGLWSTKDQAFLIDSLINEYDLPKFYIADFTYIADSELNEKGLPFAIIDGKQRFEAIVNFFDNKLPLNKDIKVRSAKGIKLGGLLYKDIVQKHPEIATRIEEYRITMMRVITDEPTLIEEMFVRLNRGKSLAGAEIRNAMVGNAAPIVREVVLHDVFAEKINFSTQRGQDLNAAMKLVVLEMAGGPANTKKPHLDKGVHVWANSSEASRAKHRRTLLDTLDKMSQVFGGSDDLLKTAGPLPVYYLLIKDLRKNELSNIRSFLTSFNSRITEARKLIKLGKRVNDSPAASYIEASRSTNDEASYRQRLRILYTEYEKYKSK